MRALASMMAVQRSTIPSHLLPIQMFENMKPHLLAAFFLSQIFAVSSSSGREIDLGKPSAKIRRFISDVVFMVEAGDRERYSKRLPESIIVQYHGEVQPKAMAEKHLTEFCQITGVKVTQGAFVQPPVAKVDIHFGPQAELARLAKEMDRQITLPLGYTFWIWWDEKRIIDRAAVFLATDRLSDAALEDRYIELLLGVFGLPSHSKEYDESCLSTKEQVLTTLQPLDKAMLEFVYRAVPAGTKQRDIDKIFEQEWLKKP